MPGPFIFYALGKYAIHRLNKANTLDDMFTPANEQRVNAAYREQIGLGANFKFNKAPFTEYMEARKKSIDAPETIFKDEKLKEALKDDSLKKMLHDALSKQGKQAPDPKATGSKKGTLTAAADEYQKQAEVFGQLTKKIPPLKVEAVIQTMKEIVDNGVKEIQKQQQLEKNNLKTLLASPDFEQKLKDQKITAPKDIAAIKKSMTSDLDKSHEAQLKGFKDATSNSVKELHSAARADFDQFSFLDTLARSNDKMSKVIRLQAAANKTAEIKGLDKEIKEKEQLKIGAGPEQLKQLDKEIKAAQERREHLTGDEKRAGAQALEQTIKDKERLKAAEADPIKKAAIQKEIDDAIAKKADLTRQLDNISIALNAAEKANPNVGYVQLSQLKVIHSNTGKEIHQKKEGEFTLEIGAMLNPFGSPAGYFMGNKIEHDMTLMAEAVKAGGKKSIIMDINYSDESMAKKRAEQAYKGCLNAGFPPDKIKVNVTVNGKKIDWKPEEAFTPDYLKKLQDTAEKRRTEKEKSFVLKTEGHDTAPVKAELQQLRAQAAAEEQRKEDKAKDEAVEGLGDLFNPEDPSPPVGGLHN